MLNFCKEHPPPVDNMLKKNKKYFHESDNHTEQQKNEHKDVKEVIKII